MDSEPLETFLPCRNRLICYVCCIESSSNSLLVVLKSGDVSESTQRTCTTQRIGTVPRISPRESNSISLEGKIEFTHLTTTLGFFCVHIS